LFPVLKSKYGDVPKNIFKGNLEIYKSKYSCLGNLGKIGSKMRFLVLPKKCFLPFFPFFREITIIWHNLKPADLQQR